MIRLQNVMTKWEKIEVGKGLSLSTKTPRRVRIEFNCPAPTRLDIAAGGKVTFLAAVLGHEMVEFSIDGACDIVPTSEDDVWYFTDDGGLSPVTEGIETVSFTKIMQRRARNPQLEMLMFRAEQNMNRRFAQLEAEAAAWRAKYGTDPDTGEVLEKEKSSESESKVEPGADADGDADEGGGVAASASKPVAKGAKANGKPGA